MTNWTEEEKRKIWDKGEIAPRYDKNVWRKDQCGVFIKWDSYGNRSNKYNSLGERPHKTRLQRRRGYSQQWPSSPMVQ